MDFIPVDLIYKDKINSYLKQEYIKSSELTFLTMFIWRKPYQMQFAESNGCLIFKSKDDGNPAALRFPIGSGDKKSALQKACQHMQEIGEKPKLYGVTEDQIERLEQICPGKFTICEMEGSADYVYSTEKLITLAGKKLHSKRNHLNNFIQNEKYEYSEITENDADSILKGYDQWLDSKDIDRYLQAERESIEFILRNWNSFDVKGGKITINGSVVAFAIGERLNKDTALIQIEKANSEIRGSYAAINQMFAENAWSDTIYINREEDMGIPGLRKAKQSYNPEFMVKKYKAILKKEID